jgi:hypothetical protein
MTGGPSISSGQVIALALLAAALLVGGTRHGRHRLRALQAPPAQPAPEGPPVRPAWVAVGAAAAGALGWAAAGATAGLLLAAITAGAGVLATRRGGRPGGVLAPEPDTDLAAGWQLLAVCLEAGLPVALAVTAAAEPLRGVVGARLRRTAGLLELGADASAAWLAAEQLPALATFAAGRSAGTGSALAQVARAEAERIRAGLLDTAQAKAQRAAVLITAPLGVCFLPAFMVLGIAPVVVGLAGEVLANW